MSQVEKYRPYYTYQDYLGWEGRWELIDGMPYAMSPAPHPRHQRIVSNLHHLFHLAIDDLPCQQCSVYDFIDWKISEDTVIQPDLLVVCNFSEETGYLTFPPELIIEVLSPSSAIKDRREKFDIYQQQKVKYYLIIDPAFNKIEIFLLKNGLYEIATVNPPSFTFDFPGCSAIVDFGEAFKK